MEEKNVIANLPTKYGKFKIKVWNGQKGLEPIALITEKLDTKKPVLVRLHSECMTGDTFGSKRCDCGEQKEKSLEMIYQSGNGIFIYLRQEGRNIGLFEKIKAMILQEQGYDTHEANILLGHDPDPREYSVAKNILEELGITHINLITNNLSKVTHMRGYGFSVCKRIPVIIPSNKYNQKYLETKAIKMRHLFTNKNSNYYFGISSITKTEEINMITSLIKKKIKDPFLKINGGINVTNSFLSDKKEQKDIAFLFKENSQNTKLINLILHYSFKNSLEYLLELKKIIKFFPYIKYIQLNDLGRDYLEALRVATIHFSVIFPINDSCFFLLENPEFVALVKKKNVTLLLDNSKGRGIKEKENIYRKKIQVCLEKGINNIGLAGGFGPGELEVYFSLREYFKIDFSIDAESQLKMNGVLNMVKVESYIDELLRLKI